MENPLTKATFWQSLVMCLVCASFIRANFDPQGAAFELWKNSPESVMVFLGLGVGMKMTKDVVDNMTNKKTQIAIAATRQQADQQAEEPKEQ